MPKKLFSKKDWLLAGILFLFVLVIGAGRLEEGLYTWGDDHSAYINEGIAIAEGRFDDIAKINYFYHPSELPDEAKNERLVYSWGYPLQMAVVYKLVGFDRTLYSSIIYYKIPTLLSLALTSSVLYLFFRRRFSTILAFCGALMICLNYELLGLINCLYSDLVFLFFCMLTLLLMECYSERVSLKKPSFLLAVCFAISLLFTYETRLNGLAVCLIALLGHGFVVLKGQRKANKYLGLHVFPYILFALLAFLIEYFWLAPATKNVSDIDGSHFLEFTSFYLSRTIDFLGNIYGRFYFLGYVLAALSVLGFVTGGFSKNLYLQLLLIGTMIVNVLLPYQQGLRYIINVLPIVVMNTLYGLQYILQKLPLCKMPEKTQRVLLLILGVLLVAYPIRSQTIASINLMKRQNTIGINDVYSTDAVEIYRYIQEATPQDAIICFSKPRSLYLNTMRLAFHANINGHQLCDADYYLLNKHEDLDGGLIKKTDVPMKLVMENSGFSLYRITKNDVLAGS